MEENVRPIKPSEIVAKKEKMIPAAMIVAVNELIVKDWDGHSATIKKENLIKKYFEVAHKKDNAANRHKLYEDNSLDFESIYRKQGWKVNYESPSYGDSDFEPYFEFEVKGKR